MKEVCLFMYSCMSLWKRWSKEQLGRLLWHGTEGLRRSFLFDSITRKIISDSFFVYGKTSNDLLIRYKMDCLINPRFCVLEYSTVHTSANHSVYEWRVRNVCVWQRVEIGEVFIVLTVMQWLLQTHSTRAQSRFDLSCKCISAYATLLPHYMWCRYV